MAKVLNLPLSEEEVRVLRNHLDKVTLRSTDFDQDGLRVLKEIYKMIDLGARLKNIDVDTRYQPPPLK